MSFNGSGAFIRTDGTRSGSNVCQQQADAGIGIEPDLMDTQLEGIATGLEACLTKDGQTGAMTAPLAMGSQKITGLADGTLRTDASTLKQVQAQATNWVSDIGSASAIVVNPSPAITAYAAGQVFRTKLAAGVTGATVANISSLGNKNVLDQFSDALVAGAKDNGELTELFYDGTQFLTFIPAIKKLHVVTDSTRATPTSGTPPLTIYTVAFTKKVTGPLLALCRTSYRRTSSASPTTFFATIDGVEAGGRSSVETHAQNDFRNEFHMFHWSSVTEGSRSMLFRATEPTGSTTLSFTVNPNTTESLGAQTSSIFFLAEI